MKAQTLALALGFTAALAASVAQAAVVYSNLGPGDSFDSPFTRARVDFTSTGDSYQAASPFTPATDTTFGSAELALAFLGGTNAYSVTLLNDDGANRPGAAIETLSLTGVGAIAGIYGVNSLTNPTLTAGTKYWLTIIPTTSGSAVAWYTNNQGVEEAAWSFGDSFPPPPWNGYGINAPTNAFRINNTSLNGIPEPATLALFCLGLFGFRTVWQKSTPV